MGGRISDKVLVGALLVAVALLVAGRLAESGDVGLTVWGDRDLWRALAVPDHWPLFGPESNGGTRSPGGAFYLLLAAILAFGHSVIAVSVAAALLFAASVALAGWIFARQVSPLAGALVAAALAGSVIAGQALGVWNPGFILVFATAATVFGYRFLAGGGPLFLGLAAAALAIGMQIHLQITQVALGLALATLVYRPRLSWRHAVALAFGFGLPFLPNLVSNSARLVETAASLPSDAVTNYVFWEVERLTRKAQLVGMLFGGGADDPGDRLPWLRLPLLAGDLLALGLAGAGTAALCWRRRRVFGGAPVGLFPLILLVTVVTALSSDLLGRHMVAVAPAAAALVGLTAERLLVALARRGALAQAGAVLVVALIALRPLALGGAGFLARPFQMDSVEAQSEIAATLKPAFFADRDAFESHVAEFRRTGSHRWIVVSNGIPNHLSFLFQTATGAIAGGNREECLAIVAKAEADGDLRKGLAASPSLAGLGAAFGETLSESAHFLYLPYTTRDGNCLKTFPNGYIPTAFEAAHLPAGAPAGAWSSGDAAIFAVPQPGHAIPTGIELRHEAQGYVAVLHGALLRGYTGLYFRSMVAPTLCLVGDQGVQVMRFGTVTVGSPQRGALAPWRSAPAQMPDGTYRLWLIATDGRQPIAIRDPVGSLTLPSLDAAPPADSAAPPPECLSPAPGR